MKRLILIVPILLLLLQGCVTSKSLTKKGTKLEAAGQYSAAADMYYQAVKKNARNTEAIISMNRVGNRVLGDYLQEFSKYALSEDYKRATYAFIDAKAYHDKLKGINIDLKIPPKDEDRFAQVKQAYIVDEYEKGLKNISLEQFSQAEAHFNEVYKFDPNYKDVAELRNIAFLEPIYRKAEKMKNEKQYRQAYNIYEKILQRVGDYKETRAHRDYVLQKGQIPIAFSSIENTTYALFAKSVKQNVISDIVKINDPFIRIVDRDDINKVLQEQQLALSGRVNKDQQVELGEIVGAKYAVIIDVISYDVEFTPLKKTRKQGFEAYEEKYYDETAKKYKYKTLYRKKYYYEYSAYKKVSMAISYKILSLTTGEVIATDVVRDMADSEVYYATYSGKKSALHPSDDGHVNTSSRDYYRLQKLFEANQTLKSRESLTNEIYQKSSNIIANSVVSKFQ